MSGPAGWGCAADVNPGAAYPFWVPTSFVSVGHAVQTRMYANGQADWRQLVPSVQSNLRYRLRAHVFASTRRDLEKTLRGARKTLKPDAAVWVSWPKKSSKGPTDITEDVIRDVALPMGFVDIKVCAVDDTWSGLKLVVRKELRG